MKISLNTLIPKGQMAKYNGFGYATDRMLDSLQRLGYHVGHNDASADVGLVFDQPERARWFGDQYRVLYVPWESTQLKAGWRSLMHAADEIWTPSPLIADWFRTYGGIEKPVHVYEHGVDPIWTPYRRSPADPIRLLHQGGEALRKGLSETQAANRRAFAPGESELTIKMVSPGWKLSRLPRAKVVNKIMSVEDMVQMYHDHHIYVYPSWGEGFGLTPLQAMATGMPVVTVDAWAPYADLLHPNLKVESRLIPSPWPKTHPGRMFKPNVDSLVNALRYARENYEEVSEFAFSTAPTVARRYSWDDLTKDTFFALKNRLESLAH